DNTEKDVTREVVWSMNPTDIAKLTGAGEFEGLEEGRTIVKAFYKTDKVEEIGLSTLNIEEEWSSEWEDPISHADDLAAKALPPPPDAFTLYVLCNKSSGDVVYGEDTNPTKFEVLAGPLQGPRAAKLWIDQNIPSWRCGTTTGRKGDWKVLCDKQNYSVGIGKSNDVTRFLAMASGFTSEKDARSWVTQSCPSWICNEGGGCAETSRGGGQWAVVCSKKHGGIGLTRHPDPTNSWIYADGLRGEKDARLWVEQRCPSWRCNREGMCIPGALVKRDKPLELPPDFDEMNKPTPLPKDSGHGGTGYETGQETGSSNGSLPSKTTTTQTKVESTPRENFSATCIFKSKTKTNLEIGRRLINASSKQELDAMIRQQCTTNDFDMSVQYKEAATTVHSATCIFLSKTKANLEIGRRLINASSKQELGAMIRQQCTTNDFNVKVQID
ncbi:MAG: hypothetical protein KJP19_01460, partial [Deltaproteobacteria bacterium]|nr:hypothetical protein [Deltaproteobacteria bacterium]